MADFEAARTAMVDCQVRPSDVTSYGIIEAMLWAPRERFVPKAKRAVAYAETEIPLTADRVILPPRVLAKMIEAASVTPDDLVLDLAPGLGYSTAILSRLAAAVVAIEPDETLADQAQAALDDLERDNVMLQSGDPAKGDPAHGPFDVIFVNGAVQHVPQELIDQMKVGGRLVAIFNDASVGQCRVMVKTAASASSRLEFDASAPVLAGFQNEKAFAF